MSHQPRTPLTRRALLTRAAAAAAALPLLPPIRRATGDPGSAFTTHAQAWDAFVEGMTCYRRYTAQDNVCARELFEHAIHLDAAFARAYAMVAATHRQDGNMEWTANRDRSEGLAYAKARTAVVLARRERAPQPSLPAALEQLGWVLLYQGDHQGAIAAAQEAVQRNPDFAEGYALWAHILSYMGEPQEALAHMAEAMRLNPRYPFLYAYNLGHVYYALGYLTGKRDDYAEAEKYLREAMQKNPNHRPSRAYLVAVLGELGGRQAEARHHMAVLREAGRPPAIRHDPRFASYIRRSLPYTDPAIIERLTFLWQAAETSEGGAV